MKNFIFLSLLLLTVGLTTYSQTAVNVSSIERNPTAISSPASHVLLNSFPNGSIPYPSAEATNVLQKAARPLPNEPGPVGTPLSFYYPTRRHHAAETQPQPADRELPNLAEWAVGLAFFFLGADASCYDVNFMPIQFMEIDVPPLSAEQIPPSIYPAMH